MDIEAPVSLTEKQSSLATDNIWRLGEKLYWIGQLALRKTGSRPYGTNLTRAFPSLGRIKPKLLKIMRLRKEIAAHIGMPHNATLLKLIVPIHRVFGFQKKGVLNEATFLQN